MVPDYALPDAVCVPFGAFTIRGALETLAARLSERAGVILICDDPDTAQDFVAGQAHPEHFGLILGAFDTPWLRDHAPVALRVGDGLRHVRPLRYRTRRERDAQLFGTIFPKAGCATPQNVAGGNLVAGPDGLVISTVGVLEENALDDPAALQDTGRALGIRDWLIVPAFPDDLSRHSDCMVRFLAPDLVALCRRLDNADAVAASAEVKAAIRALRPDIRILDLPTEAGEAGFDSPVNWIQLDDCLLVPDFGARDRLADRRRALLEAQGFDVVPIPCPTTGLGGALHCLTASVFAG